MVMAVRLSEPLRVERQDDGRRLLLRDLVIDLHVDLGLGDDRYPGFDRSTAGSTVITVPAGFDTDFSSIPWVARALYRFDSVDLAGTCHDWAYYVGVPQPEADEIWRLVAISGTKRVSGWKGRLGWLALRAFGKFAWDDHAERRAAREAEAANEDPPAGESVLVV